LGPKKNPWLGFPRRFRYEALAKDAQDKPMTTANTQDATKLLDAIPDPRSGKGLAAAGLVQGLSVRNGRAGFMMEVAGEDVALYEPICAAAERALLTLPGVEKAQVVLTASEPPLPTGATRVRKGAKLATDQGAQVRPPVTAETPEGVARVIAVASGKGGVGKSTVAVNLALAFVRAGLRVGLLDADVYGPSIPTMLGVDAEPVFEDGKLMPIDAHGLKVMSIGFLVDEGSAMIWRGPMASSAVRQMIHDVRWGDLDVLVVDLPPGTGDIQLTLIQKLHLDGAVIVSTPNEIALIDVRRAAAMFAKTGTPVLGVVENMAWFEDASGVRLPIFGEGGAAREAVALGVPLLAEVPIDMALRQAGDTGRPLTSGVAALFDDLARALR
jgi:ATP-binding protein involved in chromosome partitioning